MQQCSTTVVVSASTHMPVGFNSVDTIIMEFGGDVTLHQVRYDGTSCPEEEEGEPHCCAREQLDLGKCLRYSLDVANALLFLPLKSTAHLDLELAHISASE